MVTELSENDFLSALEYLIALEGVDEFGEPLALVFPYGVFPGQSAGGAVKLNTQENWEAYQWNPPQFSKHTDSQEWTVDNPVSPKPTWKMLVDSAAAAKKKRMKKRHSDDTDNFRAWTRLQISNRIFNANDVLAEVIDRAAGNIPESLEAQAAEVKKVFRRHRRNIKASHPTSKRYQAVIDKAYAAVNAEIEAQLNPPSAPSA